MLPEPGSGYDTDRFGTTRAALGRGRSPARAAWSYRMTARGAAVGADPVLGSA